MSSRINLPLLNFSRPQETFAVVDGRAVTREKFLADMLQVADQLPEQPYAINLCENRYYFAVGFMAAMLRGQHNLLPPNQLSSTIEEITADYPDSYSLSETAEQFSERLQTHKIEINLETTSKPDQAPEISADHIAAILFTSGSTGKPVANPKTWHQLVKGVELILQRFNLQKGELTSLVATVPAQHMFGLECTLLAPLFGNVLLQTERPFYPDDIRQSLEDVSAPRVLITTPMHIRACITADCDWPELGFIVSATDNLSADVAADAELALSTQVFEILGCTEAGAFATRRTVTDKTWRMLPGMRIFDGSDVAAVRGPQLPESAPLQDIVQLHSDTEFELLGRQTDLIKVAGKRASLNDLNIKLQSIDGVEDGVFIPPDKNNKPGTRLAAIIVAPETTVESVLAALGKVLDPVFFPRPLLKADKLPRNATGKLPREALLQLLRQIHCMSFTKEFSIPTSHPSLPGHFPDNPVVPGVVILQQIEIAFQNWQKNVVLSGWPQVKFLQPVSPDQKVEVKFDLKNNQQAGFKCVSADKVVASGIFEFQRMEKK
ncbi:MAG TPA: AMP-dependent synthetase [Thiotrichales bacterium]|nr:AMP-dependent synthetase [Thiotrichales bacterium]